MSKILIELDLNNKAYRLLVVLSLLDFVKKVPSFSKTKVLTAALLEHENQKAYLVKRKNKAIVKYI